MAEGWIKIHRKLQDCEIWSGYEPYDMRSAWIDLLLLANHRDVDMLFDYEPITVKRGQYLTSVRKLGERWSWSKNRVLKYLRLLEKLKMIEKKSNNQRTLLTIVNYGIYQDCRDTDVDTSGTQEGHGYATNKNDKNDKNKYIDIVGKIIEYLNQVLGTRYTIKSKSTYEKIKARIDEGHSFEDFKTVIDKKHAQWGDDPKMAKFLRPETLFCASHFESYLNEIVKEGSEKPKKNSFSNFNERKYDYGEIEKIIKGEF